MKKKLIVILTCVILLLIGCSATSNINEVEANSNQYGMIKLPNGEVVKGKVDDYTSWGYSVYEVTIDGKTYKTHCSNIVIIE